MLPSSSINSLNDLHYVMTFASSMTGNIRQPARPTRMASKQQIEKFSSTIIASFILNDVWALSVCVCVLSTPCWNTCNIWHSWRRQLVSLTFSPSFSFHLRRARIQILIEFTIFSSSFVATSSVDRTKGHYIRLVWSGSNDK